MGNSNNQVEVAFHVIDSLRQVDGVLIQDVFSEKRLVSPSDSLRGIANEIILSRLNDLADWDVVGVQQGTNPLLFSLFPLEVVQLALKDGYFRFPRIDYGLAENGAIIRLEIMRACLHDFSWIELQPLVDSGYIAGDVHNIVVIRPPGLGAAGGEEFDFLIWLAQHKVFLDDATQWVGGYVFGHVLDSLFRGLTRKLGTRKRDRVARKIVSDWNRNSFTGPRDLRMWLDVKDSWQISELCHRLKISKGTARSLLKALGYLPRGGVWWRSEKSGARKRRKRWVKGEPNH
ncbi:MAG: hypothetical protein JJE28_08480 [Actinomycetales bacterium]|nr:hypothetical protein [Actinomycetales bacterium]